MPVKRLHNRKVESPYRKALIRYFPAWVLALAIFVMLLPQLLQHTTNFGLRVLDAAPGTVLQIGDTVLRTNIKSLIFLQEANTQVFAIGQDVVTKGYDFVIWAAEHVPDLGNPTNSQLANSGGIAELFTSEVTYWQDDIQRWSAEYGLDPNLMATVMQIESCGHPTVNSSAGAQGLFQVMPFHFAESEDMLDPDTNAMRGASVLNQCLKLADGDTGLAMACYNGGPGVLRTAFNVWHPEPQRYYYWGTGIYADALQNSLSSPRLAEWLSAGGGILCDMAAAEIGIN